MTRDQQIRAAVIVAALGYFVDIYDLLLFSIIRIPSLQALHLYGKQVTTTGLMLLNLQMTGMLIGGVLWGILGDKKGRLSVLFGSICIYSLANIANGLVQSVPAYACCRLVAGIGLAGELGAGITLVAELMPKEKRGFATTIVAAVGVSGAVAANFIAQYFAWRTSFFIGGGLGVLLLLLRISVTESGLFQQAQKRSGRGNMLLLFNNWQRFWKYLSCILIGVPLWFVVGVLVTLAPEFAKALHVNGAVKAGRAVACCYTGLIAGDIVSGLISQLLRSRKKVVFLFLCFTALSLGLFLGRSEMNAQLFYIFCGLLGFSVGYWVIFMTIAAEQFGTNIRATVTTTVPNFVRAAVVPLSILFQFLTGWFQGSLPMAAALLGALCLILAMLALKGMKETFSLDLDYLES